MSGILSLLKILLVPVLVAALNQAVLLFALGLTWQGYSSNSPLTNGDAARVAFIGQTEVGLVLTLMIGLPFLRFCARRNRSGYTTWLAAWVLVHAPTFLWILLVPVDAELRWMKLFTLSSCTMVISSLWWWLFYAERPAGKE